MNTKPYYKTPTDIAFYFRDRDSIKELLEFIFDEAASFSDAIDRNGNQIPYPIIVDENTFSFQIDFQFMVHCIAKFVAIKTEENGKYVQVLRHFSINRQSIGKGSVHSEKSRLFLTYLMEYHNNITQLSNIGRSKTGKLSWNSNYIYAQKLIKYKDNFFDFKAVNLANSDRTGEQIIGPYKYLGEEWKAIRERFRVKNPPVQVAFGKEIKEYCNKNNIKKFIYFHVDLEFISDFYDYEIMSKIDGN